MRLSSFTLRRGRGRYRTEPEVEQPRVDRRPSRKAKACQHGRRQRQAGARRRRHTKQECRDKSQTLELHAPRGVMSQCISRVEEERDNASRGNHSRGTIGGKHSKQHCPCMIRSRTRPEEVISEKGNRREPPRPEMRGHSNSRYSMWRRLRSLTA